MPASVAGLLQSVPRFAPHFTFTTAAAGSYSHEPDYPSLAAFLEVDPFEVASVCSGRDMKCARKLK